MKLLNVCKSKIHRATVTEANVDYVGSITIDVDLMERSGIKTGELVHVWNVENANRFETYALPGAKRSGIICINGAAAHLASAGDMVIIAAYCDLEVSEVGDHRARVVLVDEDNRVIEIREQTPFDRAP